MHEFHEGDQARFGGHLVEIKSINHETARAVVQVPATAAAAGPNIELTVSAPRSVPLAELEPHRGRRG